MKKNNKTIAGSVIGATAGITTGAAAGVAASFALAEDAQAAEVESIEPEIIPDPIDEVVVVAEPTNTNQKVVEPHVEEVHEDSSDVEVIGYETITDGEGNYADVASVSVDGVGTLVIDADQDGMADILAYDENQNGYFEDNEFHNISDENISMQPLYVAAHNNDAIEPETHFAQADPVITDPCFQNTAYEDPTDMPDFVNDADVDSFLA